MGTQTTKIDTQGTQTNFKGTQGTQSTQVF